MAKTKGPIVAIGDLVWVWTGIHEDLGTVAELGCEYEEKKDGIRVKFNVSSSSGIFPPTCVRAQVDTGRPSRRSTSTLVPTHRVRQVITPSPNPAGHGKRSLVESKLAANKRTRQEVSPECKPSDLDDTVEGPKKSLAICSKELVAIMSDSDADTHAMAPEQPATKAKTKLATKKKSIGPKFTKKLKPEPEKETVKAHKGTEKISLTSEPKMDKNGTIIDMKGSVGKKSGTNGKDILEPVKKQQIKRKKAALKINDDENELITSNSKLLQTAKKEPQLILAVDTDSDDDTDDKPFKVEYSGTGRATCRRCDCLIEKGGLRISHVPLFRGKPGYRVYRHLHCAVFSEEIVSALDIGGWKKLAVVDYEKLVARVEESKIEIEKENEELQPDELVPVSFQGKIRPAPSGLAGNLLPFQTEGVSWMYHQEVNETIHGGILADEMGMGKTIQTIVTILDNRPRLQHTKLGTKHAADSPDLEERKVEEALWNTNLQEWEHEMKMNDVPASITTAKGGTRAGTLVICPVIAISQWKAEIEKFTQDGSLTIGTYHGPNRATDMPQEVLCKYDVVLTTYQVLEADFRKMMSPNKVKCPNCGGKFKVDKLRVHLKYFCGDGAQRTEAQARQTRRGGDPQQGSLGPGKGSFRKKPTKSNGAKSKNGKGVGKSSSADLDSENDLSLELESSQTVSGQRSSRSAAMHALKKMASSKSAWGASGAGDIESEEEYSDEGDTSESESEEDEISHSSFQKLSSSDVKSKGDLASAEDSDESEGYAVKQAREAQLHALRKIKSNASTQEHSKQLTPTKKDNLKKKNKSKKFSNDHGDDPENDDVDPMESIDMNKLLKEAMEGSQMSILHSICWWRIVLDEAHMIKSRSSQTANASFALIGIHRWCLSGTPLQNRVGEFYSLIRFLRIDPMAHYFCRKKGCDCKSLHYRMMNGKCQSCGHGSVQHFSHFNKHILNPIQRSGYSGDGRRAMFTLKNEVLDKSLLRRTKETRAEDMNLPPRLVSIRTVRMHPVEEDFYNALYTQTKSSFNDYVSDGVALNNYAHLFDLLMRMRQAVCHPYLVVYSKRGLAEQTTIDNGAAVANGSTECDICHEPPTDRLLSSCCQSAFCQSCVRDYMAINAGEGAIPCPSCRRPFSIDLNQVTEDVFTTTRVGSSDPMPLLKDMSNVATGSILRRINLREFSTSTKIEALVEELVRMRQTSPGSKAIVFSQFVNMLDLIRWRLHSDPHLSKMGLGYRGLHGGMNIKARDACLKEFREDSNIRVLLMSLKAGGVALNLTVANHIYLMDPWWNPAAEMQAIDRTHRLGQYRPIRAVRFIAEDTVEERIVQLQDKKRLVFDGTIGRDAGSLQTLSLDDMKSLFA